MKTLKIKDQAPLYIDDREDRKFWHLQNKWAEKLKPLSDEMLIYIIQRASYLLNKRNEERK